MMGTNSAMRKTWAIKIATGERADSEPETDQGHDPRETMVLVDRLAEDGRGGSQRQQEDRQEAFGRRHELAGGARLWWRD